MLFCLIDIPLPTLNDVPPHTLEEISSEQCREENIWIVRECIDPIKAPTVEELGGLPETRRIYADILANIYIRGNILGIVEEPYTGFKVLVPHSLVDKVLEIDHTL